MGCSASTTSASTVEETPRKYEAAHVEAEEREGTPVDEHGPPLPPERNHSSSHHSRSLGSTNKTHTLSVHSSIGTHSLTPMDPAMRSRGASTNGTPRTTPRATPPPLDTVEPQLLQERTILGRKTSDPEDGVAGLLGRHDTLPPPQMSVDSFQSENSLNLASAPLFEIASNVGDEEHACSICATMDTDSMYKCDVCTEPRFFLCETCFYEGCGDHDEQHGFSKVERVREDSDASSIRSNASHLYDPCRSCMRLLFDDDNVYTCQQCVYGYIVCQMCVDDGKDTHNPDHTFALLNRNGPKDGTKVVKESSVIRKSRFNDNGNKLINEYCVIRSLGLGGYAKVKLVQHIESHKLYAIKIMKKSVLHKIKRSDGRSGMDEALREIAIMKCLEHPNVVHLYEVIDDPSCEKLYLILEYVKNGPLIHTEGQTRPLEEIQRYANDVANGLLYLHTQVIYHRDIKPANILISEDDTAKLIDFGVSQSRGGSINDTVGTPAFLCPEACKGEAVTGHMVDAWAFGVTLYCTYYGVAPFQAASLPALYDTIVAAEPEYRTIHELQNRTPPQSSLDRTCFEDMLRRLLHKDITQRLDVRGAMCHPFLVSGKSEPAVRDYAQINVTDEDANNAVVVGKNVKMGFGALVSAQRFARNIKSRMRRKRSSGLAKHAPDGGMSTPTRGGNMADSLNNPLDSPQAGNTSLLGDSPNFGPMMTTEEVHTGAPNFSLVVTSEDMLDRPGTAGSRESETASMFLHEAETGDVPGIVLTSPKAPPSSPYAARDESPMPLKLGSSGWLESPMQGNSSFGRMDSLGNKRRHSSPKQRGLFAPVSTPNAPPPRDRSGSGDGVTNVADAVQKCRATGSLSLKNAELDEPACTAVAACGASCTTLLLASCSFVPGLHVMQFSAFANVTVLRMENCGLDVFPSGVLFLPRLRELRLGRNKFTEIPWEHLGAAAKELSILDLNNNRLQEMPTHVGLLNMLAEVVLYGNFGIQAFTPQMRESSDLKVVLDNNPKLIDLWSDTEVFACRAVTVLWASSFPHRILDNVYISSSRVATSVETYSALPSIVRTISCCRKAPSMPVLTDSAVQHTFPFAEVDVDSDDPRNVAKLAEIMKRVCDEAQEAASQPGRSVLFFCESGLTRSSALVAAFLALQAVPRFTVEEALDTVKDARSNARPPQAFLEALEVIAQE